jgi:hypothetical protein
MNSEEKHLFDELNEIYSALNRKAEDIRAELRNAGIATTSGFFNNHFIKINGEYQAEAYPIPVISAGGALDIGLDLAECFAELHIPMEAAAALDYSAIFARYNAEVYGAEDYLGAFAGRDTDTIVRELRGSGESAICVCVIFPRTASAAEIAECAIFLLSQQ